MNFRTFFSLLFIISISICLGTTFFPDIIKNTLENLNINNPIKFIGLTSLIISIFSYIGMLISFYFASKREKLRLKKLEEDRKNIAKIHEELNSLR
jgi:predicted histidine transporter YuiF (NhaC family)